MSFYMYLPSNGSHSYFPNNKIASFQTKIPKRLKFNPNEFEVGLAEFTFINSIRSITSVRDCLLTVTVMYKGKLCAFKLLIPNIRYSSINHLVSEIKKTIAGRKHLEDGQMNSLDRQQLIHFADIDFDTVTNRVNINVKIDSYQLIISEKLSRILRFCGNCTFETGNNTSEQPPDLLCGMHHIFVYCDIIQPQIVSSSIVPLLRMVNISGDDGKAVTSTFRPYYLPLSRTEFDVITILLCNEFGEIIHFDEGQSTVTLHFRKL